MKLALLGSLLLHGALLALLALLAQNLPPLASLPPPLQVQLLAVDAPQARADKAGRKPAPVAMPPAPKRASGQMAPALRPTLAAPSVALAKAMPPAVAARPESHVAVAPVAAPSAAATAAIAAASGRNEPAKGMANTAATGSAGAERAEKAGAAREVRVRFAPKPPYPALSRELAEEGVVLLRIEVLASGQVAQVGLQRSSGFVRLDKAAREGVRQWRFDAALQDGQAVTGTIEVPVHFRLDEK